MQRRLFMGKKSVKPVERWKKTASNSWIIAWKGECSTCGRYKLKMTEAYLDGLVADGSSEPGPPRQVSKSNWQQDDFFLHTKDPGPPLVTQRVVDLFTRLKIKGVSLVDNGKLFIFEEDKG